MSQKREERLIIALFLINLILFNISLVSLFHFSTTNSPNNSNKNINISAFEVSVNITNADDLNNKRFYHGTPIQINGEVFEEFPYAPRKDVNVAVNVDGTIYQRFNDTTDDFGKFSLTYIVQDNLNIYSSHLIAIEVIDDLETFYYNNLTIQCNTTSFFDISYIPDQPYLPGEAYDIEGFVRYQNGTGIPNGLINYQWYNSTYSYLIDSTNLNFDGSLPQSQFTIPTNYLSDMINLNITFPQVLNRIHNSYQNFSNIIIFKNITVIWETETQLREGEQIKIRGQVFDENNPSRTISNRNFRVLYDGALIGTSISNLTGHFSLSYIIPTGTGNRTLSIQLIDDVAGIDLGSQIVLTIDQATVTPSPPINLTPTQLFFIIGLPIILASIAVLSIAGYILYKKKLASSRLVKIPLEEKIRNMKILKDSGRFEEAISYLFDAIYMELVSTKYGKRRNDNETIRDFAIISVNKFKLDPSNVYPFVQKIEEIIYGRPFEVTEEDFYKTVSLFSPIYYQLTGFNFVLNF